MIGIEMTSEQKQHKIIDYAFFKMQNIISNQSNSPANIIRLDFILIISIYYNFITFFLFTFLPKKGNFVCFKRCLNAIVMFLVYFD